MYFHNLKRYKTMQLHIHTVYIYISSMQRMGVFPLHIITYILVDRKTLQWDCMLPIELDGVQWMQGTFPESPIFAGFRELFSQTGHNAAITPQQISLNILTLQYLKTTLDVIQKYLLVFFQEKFTLDLEMKKFKLWWCWVPGCCF